MKEINNFKRNKEYLLCVDSDGCAIDGMNVKHLECFGPCLVETWSLEKYEKEVLSIWNHINLYSDTRGINRFKGLLMTLKQINGKEYTNINLEDLAKWIESTKELSNDSLIREMELNGSETLELALKWSNSVNSKVEALKPEQKVAFKGVKECLKKISEYADIAVVSSANERSVLDEWKSNHILDYVNVVLSQECGSKKECICQMAGLGYDKDKMIMIGDAPGDIQAAQDNEILCYPLIVGSETECWNNFKDTIWDRVMKGTYRDTVMESWIEKYYQELNKV